MPLQYIKIIFTLLLFCPLSGHAQSNETKHLQLFNLKIEPLASGAQFVATFSEKPDYRLLFLDAPVRLVIDLPQTELDSSLPPSQAVSSDLSNLVQQLSYGLNGAGGTRLIIEGTKPFKIESLSIEALYENIWQMIIHLEPTSSQDFAKQIEALRKNALPPVPAEKFVEPVAPSSSFTVVLDAGHGGFDSGAEGVSGILEKDVTLAFAQTLRDVLHKTHPNFVVHLTREEDIFLRLSERIARARHFHADLFISIHADSIHLPNVRGATVYTISDQASDALAKAIAENENRSDLLDGLPSDEPPAVADILLDLTHRETDILSTQFAEHLVEHLNRSGMRLIRPPHRYAGFMVLRAPEIPSVLVELGYLSNREDEKLIADPVWRSKAAAIIAQAIQDYAFNRQ